MGPLIPGLPSWVQPRAWPKYTFDSQGNEIQASPGTFVGLNGISFYSASNQSFTRVEISKVVRIWLHTQNAKLYCRYSSSKTKLCFSRNDSKKLGFVIIESLGQHSAKLDYVIFCCAHGPQSHFPNSVSREDVKRTSPSGIIY